jgi:uncharacterized protein YegL
MNFQAYTLKNYPEWACLQVKAAAAELRSPVHLCFVIDTSASMNEDKKLENVKRSIHFLLDFLSPEDIISIVTFSEVAKVILNRVLITAAEKENIRARISIISVESNTNLSAGIVQSRECLLNDSGKYKQGILLLTDGIANLGLTRPADILEIVTNTIGKFTGTSISSIGYGTDHNVELLQSISTEGGGSYYVVNNLEDVACVFGDVLGGLISCSAQQLRVILPLGTEVKSRYARNVINDTVNIVIGDMPAGMEAVFIAKIPTGTAVTLKGYDLQTHSTFEITTTVATTDDDTININSEAHYLRFEVLTLLDQSRVILSSFSSKDTINTHINKLNILIAKIKEYRVTAPHSLWDILLEELDSCVKNLNIPYSAIFDTPSIMTQHAGYLGRMRGLPATSSQITVDSPQLTRGFSNSIQRQISAGLASQVTPVSPSLSSIPINDAALIESMGLPFNGAPFNSAPFNDPLPISPQFTRQNAIYTPLRRS